MEPQPNLRRFLDVESDTVLRSLGAVAVPLVLLGALIVAVAGTSGLASMAALFPGRVVLGGVGWGLVVVLVSRLRTIVLDLLIPVALVDRDVEGGVTLFCMSMISLAGIVAFLFAVGGA